MEDVCQEGKCAGIPDPDQDNIPSEGYGQPCSGGTAAACNDNCPEVANPQQEDADDDGIGDACETCGEYDTIDGETKPAKEKWNIQMQGDCPMQNVSFKAVTAEDDEPALQVIAIRDLACQAGSVTMSLAQSETLYGLTTIIQTDLEWDAWAYPADLAEGDLASVIVTDGIAPVVVYTALTAPEDKVCGPAVVVAEEDRRSLWRFEFDHGEASLLVFKDDIELEDSPFSLVGLQEQWELKFVATSSDLQGDCGTAVIFRVYSYEHICNW